MKARIFSNEEINESRIDFKIKIGSHVYDKNRNRKLLHCPSFGNNVFCLGVSYEIKELNSIN